jgi:hypothetical protein
VLLSALEPPELPDPLDGEFEDAAGLGALEPPELEPLSEDDFAAAGFGAGEPLPEPPLGPGAGMADRCLALANSRADRTDSGGQYSREYPFTGSTTSMSKTSAG